MADGETALDLRGLRKRYGDVVALDGVSFAVAAGEMFGFVGPNGAGRPGLRALGAALRHAAEAAPGA